MSSTKDKKQTAYKDTPIGKIPADWDVKRFNEFSSFFSGGTPLTSRPEYYGGQIPFIKSGEIYFDTTEQFLTDIGLAESSAKLVDQGDLLFALYGANSGEVAISKIKGAINQAVLCIKQDKSIADTVFLYNFLLNHKNIIIQKYLQGGQGNLSAEIVKNIQIPLPPLPEQQRIAEVLSTWDQVIQYTEQLIRQKEQRKKWLMQKLLTGKIRLKGFSGEWKKVRISDCLSRITNGITYDTEKTTGIPVTRIETISDGVINFNKIGFADPIERIEDYRLQKGDILYSHINSLAHIGKVAIYNSDVPLYHGMNLLLLRCNSKVDSNFLFQWLVSDNGRKKAISLAKKAVNQASINISELRNISISIPSLQEQTAIAEVLQAADEEIELLKAKAEKLKEQKKGLMQQLLTGKKRLNLNLQD